MPGGGDPLGCAQVGKALLHSKGGFVAQDYRACRGGASGLVRPAGRTELNNAPASTHLPRPAFLHLLPLALWRDAF